MDQACKIDMEEIFQSMQAGTQEKYNLNELTYDTQFNVSNLSNNSTMPESDGDIETSLTGSTQNSFYNNWILLISGVCILIFIVFSLVKRIERKK